MQIIEKIALITINETLVILLVSFLIFLFIINRLMFRPLRTVMSEREDYIQRMETEIKSAASKYEEISDKIKAHESEARADGFRMKDKIEKTGDKEAQKIFNSVRQEIVSSRQEKEKQINTAILQARKSLASEAEILAQNIMEKILDRRLSV